LNLPRLELRPLPSSVVVVAFPEAYGQSGWKPPAGYAGDFFVVQAPASEIEIPQKKISSWLTLSEPEEIWGGASRINYTADDNTLSAKQTPVPLKVRGKLYQVEFIQQGGYLVQDEMVQTLNSPLTVDFAVAVTYIASLIKKIPLPPIKLLVTIVAVLAIVALGFIIAAARHAFANVPEPEPLSFVTNGSPIIIVPGISVPGEVFEEAGKKLQGIAAEDLTIALQTVKEIYWLLKQVL
jgi:hypothetical protein